MMLLLAVLALAAAEPPPPTDQAPTVEGLQQMYDQSCAAREYGAFDDLCDQLTHRLREVRAEADRAARKAARQRRAPGQAAKPVAAPAPTLTAAPAPKPPGAV